MERCFDIIFFRFCLQNRHVCNRSQRYNPRTSNSIDEANRSHGGRVRKMLLLRTYRGVHTSVHRTRSWALQWKLDLWTLFRGDQLRNPPFRQPNHGGGSYGKSHEPLQEIHGVETASKPDGAFDYGDATDSEAKFRFSLTRYEVDAYKSDDESLSPAAARSIRKLFIFPFWFVNHQKVQDSKDQTKLNQTEKKKNIGDPIILYIPQNQTINLIIRLNYTFLFIYGGF